MKMRLSVVAVLALLAAGCGEPAKQPPVAAATGTQPPVLIDMFPASTVAGKNFNVQPDGNSALGVRTKGTTSNAVIVFGSRALSTAHGADFMSTTVPPDLYATAGKVPVFVRDTNGESNRIDFIVTPAK